ncbi:electron transport complex subunit RsxA [bacterium 210820-DFI.6.52]|uniref:Ion-translocating oxidoreductase complex subunit A n=1 Tax=Bittarella massiliensis (ex Durand et al. 2017) TaxID=1720313 RepID=A0AAQ1RWK5_9FIRM|nr:MULTISPECIES: electron transport complex subunit RsxA [Eubacteriales]MCB5942081.1 electron transport complex subunit RsxA [bacterium 210820-DFI.6.52]ERJ01004.1 electron transport complex protein RnfA [Clostridium sp. ATCC 29733]MZL70500.1 electron transport complex subunit RsxA [Bittarella massiliensis (ex Durand et al. 2017)]MZL80267.1 electron transport complex subunit RsxA [Bittarella massiliensis (ex Durand et al. 2017)]SHG35250.1 electron transport complex protein RnfA [Bittarella mass
MKQIFVILVSAILVDNFVLSKFLGCCPFLGVSKKMDSALGMSGAVIFVMGLASAATWPIQHYLLEQMNLEYMNTLVFILVIAALVQLVEIILKRYIPSLHKALGIYLPLITTNCAVLGVTMLNVDNKYGFWESVVNGVGAGVGFMLALVLFAGVRRKLESCDVPKAFQGLPITLVAASLVSLSFMGFAGLAENMFK